MDSIPKPQVCVRGPDLSCPTCITWGAHGERGAGKTVVVTGSQSSLSIVLLKIPKCAVYPLLIFCTKEKSEYHTISTSWTTIWKQKWSLQAGGVYGSGLERRPPSSAAPGALRRGAVSSVTFLLPYHVA